MRELVAEAREVLASGDDDRLVAFLRGGEPFINYTGTDESVECSYEPCKHRLRRADGDAPQYCSKAHREGRPLRWVEQMQQVDIVFDGPPAMPAPAFVEVEDLDGNSIRVGTWVDRGDGTWALRLPTIVRDDIPDADYSCGAAFCDDPVCTTHSRRAGMQL